LIGDWSLDETGQQVPDTSGSGVAGTLGATAGADEHDPVSIDGVEGRALRFDGDDWVTLPDRPALEPAHITVEAWFRGDRSPGQWRYIVSKGGKDCEASSYGLYSASNEGLGFYVYDGTTYTVSPLAARSVWDGRWHHAAGTFDGSTVRLFVDGKEVGSGTPASTAIRYGIASKGIYIGAYRGTCDLPFVGDIDRVRIWSEALGAPEIAAAATMTSPSASTAGSGKSGGGGGSSSAGGEKPDLELAYSTSTQTARPGTTVVHRIRVRLENSARASGTSAAVATLALPAGLELVSAKTNTGPGCTGTLLVTCPLGSILGAAVAEIDVAVKVMAARKYVTVAEVSAKEGDLDPTNNRASATLRATGAAAKARPPKIVARGKARARLAGRNAVVTASVRVGAAAKVSVRLERSPARRVVTLPGSRVGSTTIRTRARVITTSLVGPRTLRVQLLVPRSELAPGIRHTLFVTARGGGGRAQVRLTLRA
jgi:hypothetical protein